MNKVGSKSVAEKVTFIDSEIDFFSNEPLPESTNRSVKFEKIFFDDSTRSRRDWLVLKDEKLLCVYCICFSENNLDELSSSGLSIINKDSRASQKVRRHEQKHSHRIAENLYSVEKAKSTNFSVTYNLKTGENREIVGCIIKTIMYIVTHGKE